MRVSVTTLESFRLFLQEEWFTEKRFLEQLSGKFISTLGMEFGTSYHRLLEVGLEYPNTLVFTHTDGGKLINVSDAIINPALEFRSRHPNIISEIKNTKEYLIGNDTITVSGICDGVEGMILHEHKTCLGFDGDKYVNSCQYKFYFEMFGAEIVQYNVFDLIANKTEIKQAQNLEEFTQFIKSVEYNKIMLYKSPDNSDYCYNLVSQFVEYVKYRNLQSYFKDKA